MQLLVPPCDILDVTKTQKQWQNSDSVWVSLAALGSYQLHFDNIYLLVDDSTFASTNNKNLEDFRANRRDLHSSAAPALHCSRPLILLISSTIWCSFWLISAPLLSESNRRKNRRELFDCFIAVRLLKSGVDQACEVCNQARAQHRQWLCNEKAIAVLAVRRSERLELWKVVASCFQSVSFAENTSASLAPGARIFQPVLSLFFFVFLLLNLSTKRCLRFFFIPSQNLVAFKRRQYLLKKRPFLDVFKYYTNFRFEIWNSDAPFFAEGRQE